MESSGPTVAASNINTNELPVVNKSLPSIPNWDDADAEPTKQTASIDTSPNALKELDLLLREATPSNDQEEVCVD
jgi:hypothetical protein